MSEEKIAQTTEPESANPVEEFYAQFSQANRDRAQRMYHLTQSEDGTIQRIDVVCPVHKDEDKNPLIIETIPPESFRDFLEAHPSLECPKGDMSVLILPKDMEPSVWEKAPPWERYIVMVGAAFLTFLILFFAVRGCSHLVRKIGTSPKKYQREGRRKGIVGDMQDDILRIEAMLKKKQIIEDDPEAVSAALSEIERRKKKLLYDICQAKLRDRTLLDDPDIKEIDKKLREMRP